MGNEGPKNGPSTVRLDQDPAEQAMLDHAKDTLAKMRATRASGTPMDNLPTVKATQPESVPGQQRIQTLKSPNEPKAGTGSQNLDTMPTGRGFVLDNLQERLKVAKARKQIRKNKGIPETSMNTRLMVGIAVGGIIAGVLGAKACGSDNNVEKTPHTAPTPRTTSPDSSDKE